MRIILITGDGPGHRYVANKLAAEVPLVGIVVDHGKPIGRIDRIRQLFRRYTVAQLISRGIWALVAKVLGDESASERAFFSVLGAENCSAFSRPDLLHDVHGINTPEGVRVVSSLQPDVTLIFGTSIIGKKILSVARKITLNMHTGISPYYRGCDCYFWPLHNRELHMLGATVHECVKEVDGGRIFATSGIHLQADDDLFAVFARCTAAGAALYADTVRKLTNRDLQGTIQDLSVGTEYKAHQKGFLAEWKVRRAITAGLIRQFVKARRQASPDFCGTTETHYIEPANH